MRTIEVLADSNALAARAVDHIIAIATDSVETRGRFTVALAGGSTPEKTYSLLAQPEHAGAVDWATAYPFFGDERDVPEDDPRSNYGLARRTLLDRVPVPPANLFPMVQIPGDPTRSAARYTELLREFFETPDTPRFDLILLGMGDDGHCASLFPGFPTLDVSDEWVVPSPPGTLPPPVDRVTMTFPVINAARRVLFLVAGKSKAEAVRDIFDGNAPASRRPSSAVQPVNGDVTWLIDQAAASLLTDPRARV